MFEKIGNSFGSIIPFSQLSPDQQKDNLRRHKQALDRTAPVVIWVSKRITKTEWRNLLRFNSGHYCYLREDNGKIVVGFMVINTMPTDCDPMTNEELYMMNEFCKSRDIFPRPLKKVKENE